MKIVKRDEKLRAKQEQEKEQNALEEIKRMEFIETLRQNKKFQAYVVEELIQKQIDDLSDIRKFSQEAVATATPEETQRVILANLAAVKVLEKLKGKLS